MDAYASMGNSGGKGGAGVNVESTNNLNSLTSLPLTKAGKQPLHEIAFVDRLQERYLAGVR